MLIKQSRFLQDLIVKARFGQRRDDPLLNFLLVVDKIEVTETLKGTLLDQLFTCTIADAKRMQALVEVALAGHQINNLLHVRDRSVCQ